MKIEVNLNKGILIFVFAFVLIVVALFVSSYSLSDSTEPSNFGHTANEVDIILPDGSTRNLNDYLLSLDTNPDNSAPDFEIFEKPVFFNHTSKNSSYFLSDANLPRNKNFFFATIPSTSFQIEVDKNNPGRLAMLRFDISYSATGINNPLAIKIQTSLNGKNYDRWVTDLYQAGEGDRPHAGFSTLILIPLDSNGNITVTAYSSDFINTRYRIQHEGFLD